ncbi:MAG TPA: hypothetical protein VL551_16920 [Actinospica sp.]|nr:hypothetical protein [Actinospica sp.]
MTDTARAQAGQAQPSGPAACEHCGNALSPRARPGGNPKRFCSARCRYAAKNHLRDTARAQAGQAQPSGPAGRKRRPLPDAASDAAWALRKDIERIERIFADDRFNANKEKVAPLLRSHLAHTAQSCQELLGRIDHLIGE